MHKFVQESALEEPFARLLERSKLLLPLILVTDAFKSHQQLLLLPPHPSLLLTFPWGRKHLHKSGQFDTAGAGCH